MAEATVAFNGVSDVYAVDGGIVDATREVGDLVKLWLRFRLIDVPETFLDAPVTLPGSTSPLVVTSTVDFPASGTLDVASEQIGYTGKTATTFTGITRAVNGSRALASIRVGMAIRRLAAVDPTALVLKVRAPLGTVTTYSLGVDVALVKTTIGQYYLQLIATQSGIWHYRWEATGAVAKTTQGQFFVNPARF